MTSLVKYERGNSIDAGESISLRDITTPLFRRKKTILVTFFSVLAALILLALLIGPTYTSHMTILVNRERLEPLLTPESTTQMITTSTPITEEEINSEVELLTSRDVLEQVVAANRLDQPTGYWSLGNLLHPNQTREERAARAVKTLAKKIKAEAVIKTSVIVVTYSSSDPQLSYGVLNSLAEFYTQKHVAVHRPAGSFKFFSDQAQSYQDALKQAEAKLRDLDKTSGLAAPDAEEANLAQQVATSTGLMHLAKQNLAADQERIKNDRQQMNATPQRSPTLQTSTAADKLLDQLNETLVAEEKRRTQLLQTYDESYPLVRDISLQIAQSQAAVAAAEKTHYVTESTDLDPTFQALRQDVAKTEADRATHAATLVATKQSIEEMQTQLVDLDRQAITRRDLTREVKADEQTYLTYLAKREQERTSDSLDTSRIANVAVAVPPAIPVLPAFGWPVIVLAALGMATVSGLSMAYASDLLDSSFRRPDQLTDLGIPVVIVFPRRVA